MSRSARSLQNYTQGLSAERWAEWLLRCKGYRILKKRWRTPVGEIDLLATRGDQLVLVEVKRRATIDSALACVSATQQQRLKRALHYAVAALPAYAGHSWRCDLIALAPRTFPRHIVNAWEVG